ncbi:MAG: hypothetical protein JWO53_1245, partial [Chlamydiia bacterium]|nr:hypothetical protein [Chlamydiia bacterium]
QIQKDIQNQAQQALDETQKNLVSDAIFVVEETKKAINFIKNEQYPEALSSIERAIGKSDVLLARYQKSALLPVDFTIRVIDIAPMDLNKINEIENRVKTSINKKQYPYSRALINLLVSEIHVATYCLPLEYYPDALKEAVRLLELKQLSSASSVLETALNTLVVVDRIFPIPVIKAITLLSMAEAIVEKEGTEDNIFNLIEEAKFELRRSVELGYLEKNSEEYRVLYEGFTDLENKIKKDQKITSALKFLKEKFRAFLKSSSQSESVYQK